LSCDLGVWFPNRRLSHREASQLYARLCENDVSGVQPHPAVDAFYAELIAKHPEIDAVPDDRIGDHDFSPWSCALDRSPGHVIMPCVWSRADYVTGLVHELARKHGLAVYDPQSDRITYPGSALAGAVSRRRWWRLR